MCKSRRGGRSLLVASLLSFAWFAPPAQAHQRHHHHHDLVYRHRPAGRYAFRSGHVHSDRAVRETASNFAAIVVDANSGRVLCERNADEPRHPASITKVMTLYLLFEQLEKGRLHLDSRIRISEHAAEQAPTKLGLDPGDTISVDNAIKAIVTLSANDIAVAVAEAIGGDEDAFAAMMTRKAHALGMINTHYANASGLPNDEQITTAADLALLGRAIQERFPRYYRYFSTETFVYDGIANRNHDHLLGRIEGVDGIKTGYTRASGFNLLTSVKRDGHFLVAVVLGGTTSASRDQIMAGLIQSEIGKSSIRHTASLIAEIEKEKRRGGPEQPVVAANPAGPAATPDLLPVASIEPTPIPRPAFVSSTPMPLQPMPLQPMQLGSTRHVAYDGSTERPTTSTATPSMLRWVVGAPAVKSREPEKFIAKAEMIEPQGDASRDSAELIPPQHPDVVTPSGESRPAIIRSGWMIQIGATDDAAAASALLARAKARGPSALNDAEPYTEKVQKGDATLYRARFAGLDADDAEAACKSLKRSGFECFATKN
jgi:D-alanyl-D-alanine carboxypeptidase